jgi:outer membrane protein insertion porin family
MGLSACRGAPTVTTKTPAHTAKSTPTNALPAAEVIAVHVCWDAKRQVEKGEVVRVEIRGIRAPALLCERFPVRPGDPLEIATTDVNIRALYGEGRVEDVVVSKEKHDDGVVVVYDVKIRKRVRTVHVPPVQGLDAAVANELVAEAPLWEDNARFDNLVRQATEILVTRGYRHSNISIETTPEGDDEVNVTLVVDPGLRTTVGAFTVDGFSPERWTELSSMIRTKIGEPYNREMLERDVLVMTADLFDRGMVGASFGAPEIVESPDGATVNISIKVSEGPVFKMGQVKFVGDLVVPASTYLRDTWHTKTGAIFSRKKIVDDVESVKRFQVSRGAPADVDIETTLNSKSSTMDVIVRIKRQPK